MAKCLTEKGEVEMEKEGKYCNFFFIVQVNWAGSAERESESEYINQRKRAEKEGERVRGYPVRGIPRGLSLSELFGYNICKPRVTNMEKKKKKKKNKRESGMGRKGGGGVPRSGCTLIPIRVYPVGPVVGEVSRDFNKLFRKS